jgi:hypothetical protein
MMLMAGRESEIECLEKDETADFGDGNDLREIDETMSEAFKLPCDEDEAEKVKAVKLARMRVKTRERVRRHRRAIEQVALALMKHNSLNEHQIDAIVIASGVRLVERVDPATVSVEEKFNRHLAWYYAQRRLPTT